MATSCSSLDEECNYFIMKRSDKDARREPCLMRRNIGRFRSKLERKVAEVLTDFEYEPFYVNYQIESWYLPDFVKDDIWIEVKGYFRTYKDAQKLLAVRDMHPEARLILLLYEPKKPMPGAKKRKKCGTKLDMGEWATRNNLEWYHVNDILNGTLLSQILK